MTSQRFINRVVFVTGGSSGLGAATSKLFLEEGAKVFIVDLAERDILDTLGGKNVDFKVCDVSNPVACEEAIGACIQHFGRLDVLFSCAGRCAPLTTVVDMPISEFQSIINTNLCATFYLCRAAIPHMRQQGGGAIVTVGSTGGLYGDYGWFPYNASKAGVINLTRAIALDHAKEGIRANAVCPGYMRTPMSAPFVEIPGALGALQGAIPQGRGADPIEVARAVLFLASDDSSYTTGAALVVDGGLTASSGTPNFGKFLNTTQADI